jgi:hypothetical protein
LGDFSELATANAAGFSRRSVIETAPALQIIEDGFDVSETSLVGNRGLCRDIRNRFVMVTLFLCFKFNNKYR